MSVQTVERKNMFFQSQSLRWTVVGLLLIVMFQRTAVTEQTPRPRPSQPARGGAARGATLVVETDLACALTIDGEAKGNLAAAGTMKVILPRGEHIVRCVGSEDAELVWRKSVEVAGEQSRVAVIELRPLRDAKAKDTAARREQERALAEANAADVARARVEADAAQETERRQGWIRRLEGMWRTPGGPSLDTGGVQVQDAGTTFIVRQDGNGLVGTVRTDITFRTPQGWVRAETVVDLRIDVSGPTPVATLVRGQFFDDNSSVANARFVLTSFQVDDRATLISISVEYGDGGAYSRDLRR